MVQIVDPVIEDEEIGSVRRVLESGMLAQGEEVKKFEEEFSNYLGIDYVLGVSNGTSALDLSFKVLGVSNGDEVITTPFSFIASANSILFQGAKPVFADINKKTFNLDPEKVKEKITNKTKAIEVVHLFGQPVNIKPFQEIAEDHDLYLVEDCAQAHGATYKNKKVGTFGDIATFSLYATKNMTTGEGGLITTNNNKLANKIKKLRNHGQNKKYLHEELGRNERMTNIEAAIGRKQLKKLENLNQKRRKNAKNLNKKIKKIKELKTPHTNPKTKHVYHQYVIRVKDEFPLSRNELSEELNDRGIGTGIHYPRPIHHQPLYQKRGYPSDISPKSVKASEEVLSLPVHPKVSSEDIDKIFDALKNIS